MCIITISKAITCIYLSLCMPAHVYWYVRMGWHVFECAEVCDCVAAIYVV